MNDLPFGFSSSNSDDDDKSKKDDQQPGGQGPAGANPFGFDTSMFGGGAFDPSNPGAGFDPSMIGQMFSQLGQMFSGMNTASGSGDPVNYDLATRLARQQIGDFTPMLDSEQKAVADAVRLAEVWLDDVTALPAAITSTEAWTPVDWLEKTLPTWKKLCDPLATQLNNTWQDSMPEEAKALAGPMAGMMSGLGGMMFGTQLGQGLGVLAKEVLTGTDIGLPLGPEGVGVLLPQAIAKFAEGLDLPGQEIVVFLAAREAAHQRLFAGVGWLRQRLLDTVEAYARGIRVDMSGITELGDGIDPQELLSDPGKLEEIMSSAASFEPQATPEQQAALTRLETLLALIEGWVEYTVTQALGDRIPSTAALTETMRRRRATGGPAEQTFATLIGLDLRPRKLREAADLWKALDTAAGATSGAVGAGSATRDGVWDHPDLLPDADDLDDPSAFIDRVIGGGTGAFDVDDPIAELVKEIAAEEAQRKADEARGASSDEPRDTDDE
ncbi:MAG: zinc-dependent metalloprotease [Gordonia sp. (in: high G+C Gram-positive bacteria)]|uniref:zinc-dependent metalloprotease n=1 Tax=Gordonia sp. (in: high G+C Gram-positive bacteria) TaxID=84139 RepID=UPI0039E68A3A